MYTRNGRRKQATIQNNINRMQTKRFRGSFETKCTNKIKSNPLFPRSRKIYTKLEKIKISYFELKANVALQIKYRLRIVCVDFIENRNPHQNVSLLTFQSRETLPDLISFAKRYTNYKMTFLRCKSNFL